jgi:hypothetical protein
MSAQLHFNIYKETRVRLDNEHWYELVQKLVEIGHECKVTKLWNQQVQTDRTVLHNKPDVIIRNTE